MRFQIIISLGVYPLWLFGRPFLAHLMFWISTTSNHGESTPKYLGTVVTNKRSSTSLSHGNLRQPPTIGIMWILRVGAGVAFGLKGFLRPVFQIFAVCVSQKTHTQKKRLGDDNHISQQFSNKYHFHKKLSSILGYSTKKITAKWPRVFRVKSLAQKTSGLWVLKLDHMWSSQQRFFQPPPGNGIFLYRNWWKWGDGTWDWPNHVCCSETFDEHAIDLLVLEI